MNQCENYLTAVHEAGHAVAMLAADYCPFIRFITIVDQPPGQSGLV